MANREKNERMQLFVTENEADVINQKNGCHRYKIFFMYAGKMLIDGYIIKHDFSEMKHLVRELGVIGKNINQLAKRANETRNIYEQDIKDLQKDYARITGLINELLVKIIRNDKRV